jgi:hypothetical protein
MRESLITEVRAPSQVSWGAIISGWVVAASIAFLLYQLGAAVGVTAVDTTEAPGQGFGIGAGIWVFLTWLVSLFVGGWLAARLAGRSDRTVGMLHGATVWGVTVIASLLLAVMTVSNIAQGIGALGSGLSSIAGGVAQSAGQQGGGQAMQGLQAQIKQGISEAMAGGNVSRAEINQAMNQLDANALSSIAASLVRGDTEGARNALSMNTNLNQQEIDSIMNRVQSQMPKFQQQIQQQAQQAKAVTSAALWAGFITLLVALGAAIWGGAVGSQRVARVYDRRF